MSTLRDSEALLKIHPDFAPLIPGVNEAFDQIWTYQDIDEFRGNWTKTRATYPEYVPSSGFTLEQRTVTVLDGAEIGIRISRPEGLEDTLLPLLFVLHGGGWVVGGHDSENGMTRSICVRNLMAVVSVDYRRAPENQFPTPLNDCYDAFHWTVANAASLKIDMDRVILGGSSAGANLVGIPLIKTELDENRLDGVIGQLLNIPALCHPSFFPHEKFEFKSYTQNAKSPTINGQHMRWFWEQYYPKADANPLASPLLASTHEGLPPALIQVAGLDPLRDEGFAYEEVLRMANVPTRLEVFPGLPHGLALAVKTEFANRYYSNMVDWTAGRLHTVARFGVAEHPEMAQQGMSDVTGTD